MNATDKSQNKERLLFIIAAVLVLTLFITGVIKRRADRIPDESRMCTVRIFTRGGEGCGVIFEKNAEELVVATNLHVISDWDEDSYIRFYDGEKAFGQVFGGDETYDVGFISVPMEESFADYPEAVRSALMDVPYDIYFYNITDQGTEKKVKGSILSNEEFFYELDRVMLYGEAKAREGMSGTPVFTEDGGLVGILSAGNEEGIIAATSVSDLEKCLGTVPEGEK